MYKIINLGFSLITLDLSNQLIKSLAYEPQSCRTSCRIISISEISVNEWRHRLGCPTLKMTEKTISNTTNMIRTLQSETRDYMRDHYKTRVWCLCPKRINDTCFLDTFPPSIFLLEDLNIFKCLPFGTLVTIR